MRYGSLLAAWGLLLCAGCAPAVKPDVAVLDLGQMKMQALSGAGMLSLRIGNPHPEPMHLEGVQVQLRSGGSKFLKGMAPLSRTIEPFGTADVSVPVTVSNLALLRAAGVAAARKQIAYDMTAIVTFRAGTGGRSRGVVKKAGLLDGETLLRSSRP